MPPGDERHLEVPRPMQRHMSKTRAQRSASASAAMGVLKRLGLDPDQALRTHHDSPAHKRRRKRDGRHKKKH